MSSEFPSPFEDPALKAALKRAVGGERAPARLRQRVERSLADERARAADSTAESTAHRRPAWMRNPLMGLAAAALLILGFGLIFNHYWEPAPDDLDRLPFAMASDMIAAHNRTLAATEVHDLEEAPQNDTDAIRQALSARLGHPVLVASLDEGWELQGARVSNVGETPAAQTVFRKGDESVSVFSVSGRAYYTTQEGMEYKQTEAGHPLAGFVQGGIVHCVVGSKGTKLSERDLARLRDAARKHLSPPQSKSQTSSTRSGCGVTDSPARV